MTLLVNAVGHQWLAHVSDRRLTRGGRFLHDSAANKTILLVQPNIKLLISYTGIAYLGDVPTDVRIAGSITQSEISGDFAFGQTGEFDLSEATVWIVVQRIRELLVQYARELGGSEVALIVRVVGWYFKAPVYLPVAARVLGGAMGVQVVFDDFAAKKNPTQTSLFYEGAGALLAQSGFNSSQLGEDLERSTAANQLASLVRRVSDSEMSVGPDVMAITLWAEDGILVGKVQFIPADPLSLQNVDMETGLSAAHSPWIIVDSFVMQPSILSGVGPTLDCGHTRIAIEVPKTDGGGVDGIILSHRRQPRTGPRGELDVRSGER